MTDTDINVAPGVKQVGGTHYEDPIQHWDIVEAYDVDYLAAQASRYITRYDRKGKPKEDLQKAKSFLDRMLVAQRGTRRTVPFPVLQEWYAAAGFAANKRRLLNLILASGTETDIVTAGLVLAVMIEKVEA